VQSLARANPVDDERPRARPATGTHRLGYMPALDGVRALAVLAVMAYHGGVTFLPAGFFGVDAFFVLSGFLITTLLVTEWSGSRHIALRAFWARRARRLLPALLLMLLFVVLYARFVAEPGTYLGLRWDAIAALFYSANWRFIASGTNYFVQSGPVTPLLHTWSLAIEEQFYIVWPILLLAIVRFRRSGSTRALKTLLAVSVVGALVSAIEMALVFDPAGDPTRVYFGTDTHAQCLLVGAALAAGIALWRRGATPTVSTDRGRRLLSAAGLLGVGTCAWAWSQLQYGQAFVFRGGFLVVSVSVAAVIASAVLHPPGVVARALSWAPLRFLGRISYGMYLWHFPLDIALTGSRTGLNGTLLFLVRTAVTVAISTLSFYALERPIRTGTFLTAARARIATPAAFIGIAAAVVVTTLPAAAASGAVSTTPATSGGPVATVPASLTSAPVRVMLLGDSVALSLGIDLSDSLSRWHIDLENLAMLGCGVAQGGSVWDNKQGQLQKVPVAYPCHLNPTHGNVPWPTAWPAWLGAVRPNVVVLLAGRWEIVDRPYQGQRTNILKKTYAAYVKHQLELAVQIGTSTGAHMVLETTPCYNQGEQANGTPWPQDDVRRVEAYNALVRQVGAEFPSSVTVQDLFSLACPQAKFTPTLDGVPLRDPDGTHFAISNATGDLLAPTVLPLWEDLGHRQEARGGAILTGSLPKASKLPYSQDLPRSSLP
jgi:peptidoglycan/LPS O-acetylase OafA/YrhL